jgi:3-keto-5-aminohexanoate cleavage enzyme
LIEAGYLNPMTDSDPAAATQRRPVIIAAAPTGAHKSREQYPGLPITADDIAEQAFQCMAAGASMLHLHVRDAQGRHSLDAGLYLRAIEAVRKRCGDGLLIQATSEQAGMYDVAAQMAAIRALEVEFISVALTEITGAGSDRELEQAAALFHELEERGSVVQLILYSADHLARWNDISARFQSPGKALPLLFVLGRYHPLKQSQPEDLLPFLEHEPEGVPWMVCAFGARELDCMRFAASRGGHARVGFENNTLSPDGSALRSSAHSVTLTASMLESEGHRIADVSSTRRTLLGGDAKPR